MRVSDNSPERVAYDLLVAVAHAEHKDPVATSGSALWADADRKWILDTYAECLQAVRGNRPMEEQDRAVGPSSGNPLEQFAHRGGSAFRDEPEEFDPTKPSTL
jgi:hypothetical protein